MVPCLFQKTIDKMTFTLPFVCMGLIGLLLESYLHFMLKLILIPAVILTAKYISGSCLTLNSVQILPFSTYLAQKVLMYFTWFHYYWNEVSGKTNLMLLFFSFFLCYNFYKTVFSDPGYLKRSMEAKKQVNEFLFVQLMLAAYLSGPKNEIKCSAVLGNNFICWERPSRFLLFLHNLHHQASYKVSLCMKEFWMHFIALRPFEQIYRYWCARLLNNFCPSDLLLSD